MFESLYEPEVAAPLPESNALLRVMFRVVTSCNKDLLFVHVYEGTFPNQRLSHLETADMSHTLRLVCVLFFVKKVLNNRLFLIKPVKSCCCQDE